MRLRSLLFVPGDRPERFAKALASGADALILDLEDSVVAAAKPGARDAIAAFLATRPALPVFVRINPLDSGQLDADLAAIPPGTGFGVVLPKAEGATSLAALDARLAGTDLRILPIATETPRALFRMDGYGGVSDRLIGLTWGAEDLSTAVGATGAREADGRYRPPFELARSLTLFAAYAAGVAAIETVYPDLADLEALRAYAARGRNDGFSGMLALHPNQIAPIHAGFAPTDAEVAYARAIVARFAAEGGTGAFQLDGKMIDAPHLAAAQRLLGDLA
jgi:citrate lyase subunit beta/citryl-CoA lyase